MTVRKFIRKYIPRVSRTTDLFDMNSVRKSYNKYYTEMLHQPYLSKIRGFTLLKSIIDGIVYTKTFEKNGEKIELSTASQAQEQLLLDLIEGYLKNYSIHKGDLILDAGGFPGEFAIYAAKKGAEVIVLEPDESNIKKLRKNLKKNNVEDSVHIEERVLWETDGEVSFKEEGGKTSKVNEENNSKDAVTLETVINEYGCFDLVKMDIEGAETEVISSFLKSSSKCKPEFSIASYHQQGSKFSFEILEKKFQEEDYWVKTGYNPHKTTWAKYEK